MERFYVKYVGQNLHHKIVKLPIVNIVKYCYYTMQLQQKKTVGRKKRNTIELT